MKKSFNAALGAAVLVAGTALSSAALAADTIKVGILHSLSGTMAISETTLKDTMLMLIDDLNKSGGLLGKRLNRSWLTRLQTGRCLPKRPGASFKKTRSL